MPAENDSPSVSNYSAKSTRSIFMDDGDSGEYDTYIVV